jgi:hypothetical protein
MQYIFKLIIVMLPVVAFLFYFSLSKKKLLSILAGVYLILLIGATLFSVGKYVYANYHEPPKWDFLGFWLNGKVGLAGENFYDIKNYQKMPLPYDPGEEFRKEIIDVGFFYPPFTMFLFLPLGLLGIGNAYLLWQIVNLLLSVACIYGLWRLFLKDYGVLSLLLVAALMFRLEPARSTFVFAQTNFLTLLFFLIFWRNRSKDWGGIWLALGVVVKPYMALLYIYPLIIRKWKMLIVAILTLLIFTLLSFLVFGSDVFHSYLNNPIPKTPSWNYTELTNQSLLATILRLTPNQVLKESPILNPLYLGIALLLSLITVWVSINKNSSHDWTVLSILFLALIIYPGNQFFYSTFLIVPLVLLLQYSSRAANRRAVVFFIILTTYLLSGNGNYVFYANLFMWLVCIVFAAKSNMAQLPYEYLATSV